MYAKTTIIQDAGSAEQKSRCMVGSTVVQDGLLSELGDDDHLAANVGAALRAQNGELHQYREVSLSPELIVDE